MQKSFLWAKAAEDKACVRRFNVVADYFYIIIERKVEKLHAF